MRVNADEVRVADARAAYFEANGFGPDGGYDEDWVRFRVGPVPVMFPNTAGRKAAVPCIRGSLANQVVIIETQD